VLRGYAEIAAAARDELTVMAGFLVADGQMLLFLFRHPDNGPTKDTGNRCGTGVACRRSKEN
jgi:hypothetical protein